MSELTDLIERFGYDSIYRELLSLRHGRPNNALVIVANAGSHPLPPIVHTLGEVWAASQNNLDISSPQSACHSYREILRRIVKKLQSTSYSTIYVLPFGPATLAMQIKSLVYRMLHISTIDILHVNGAYFPLDIELRSLIVEAMDEEA